MLSGQLLPKIKKGYSKHPETLRWVGKLKALYLRHQKLVKEMKKRGYLHKSDLNINLATGKEKQDVFVNTIDEQIEILKNKNCLCFNFLAVKEKKR